MVEFVFAFFFAVGLWSGGACRRVGWGLRTKDALLLLIAHSIFGLVP
jgi:hypothetical protein